MMDLLWSDPTEDDTQQGIQANLRRGQVGLANSCYTVESHCEYPSAAAPCGVGTLMALNTRRCCIAFRSTRRVSRTISAAPAHRW
jgi:hypothetical protein